MKPKTIYIIAALVVIAGAIWYVMRAQNMAATINSGTATGGGAATPTVPGAST